MIQDMDNIQFESRNEVSAVMSILGTFLEEHPDAKEKEKAEELYGLLDAMHMSW